VGFEFDPQAGRPSHLVHSSKRCESDRVADQPFALHPEAPNRGHLIEGRGSSRLDH
jgi:hypothetical protein